jgi:hypothetical protein
LIFAAGQVIIKPQPQGKRAIISLKRAGKALDAAEGRAAFF